MFDLNKKRYNEDCHQEKIQSNLVLYEARQQVENEILIYIFQLKMAMWCFLWRAKTVFDCGDISQAFSMLNVK